jgi:hypothetical protein
MSEASSAIAFQDALSLELEWEVAWKENPPVTMLLGTGVSFQNELGHHAKLSSAAAANGPEQILVLHRIGNKALTVSGDDSDLVHLVRCKTVMT